MILTSTSDAWKRRSGDGAVGEFLIDPTLHHGPKKKASCTIQLPLYDQKDGRFSTKVICSLCVTNEGLKLTIFKFLFHYTKTKELLCFHWTPSPFSNQTQKSRLLVESQRLSVDSTQSLHWLFFCFVYAHGSSHIFVTSLHCASQRGSSQ